MCGIHDVERPELTEMACAVNDTSKLDGEWLADEEGDQVHGVNQNRLVYIVDSDWNTQRAVGLSLRKLGFYPQSFANCDEFVRDFSSLRPGCVLLDMCLPALNAFDVLQRMRKKSQILPVIAMSDQGDIPTAVRAMKMGAIDFLQKPLRERQLLEALQDTFRNLCSRLAEMTGRVDAERKVRTLSPREIDILRGLVSGMPNKTMASYYDLSVRTIEMHRANMMEKLNVRNLTEALHVAGLAHVERLPSKSPIGSAFHFDLRGVDG